MKSGFSSFDAAEYLRDEKDRSLYMEACVEDDPGDGSLIRSAVSDIARSRGMTNLARKTGLTREGLYRALSPDGNPRFSTMLKVLHAIGMQLKIEPVQRKSPNS